MADDKKPDAKPSGSFFSHPDPFVEIVWTLLALFILAYLANAFISALQAIFSGDYSVNEVILRIRERLMGWFYLFLALRYLLFVFSIFLLGWAIYLHKKILELRAIEHKLLYPEAIVENKPYVNPQWARILSHIESLNENDWRLAIIEADIMLSDVLEKLSLPGETIGEKLKAVEKSDFQTVDNAWEAHKVRNQIAHEGPAFMLNQREAKRVVALYETVFKEFQVI